MVDFKEHNMTAKSLSQKPPLPNPGYDYREVSKEQDFDDAERLLNEALSMVSEAKRKVGTHIPVPYHLEKAKLELRHAVNRFKIRRARLED